MSRILVIGGYGGFGARLTRRLLAVGHDVLVAGRNGQRAAEFCAGLPGTEPVVADRIQGIGLVFAAHRPDLVIDAAGPFQHSAYTVPEACIAMRIPYLDLADARAFVAEFSALDRSAREAGVALVTGASSVPALSGAVVRHLVGDAPSVSAVDIAISASNRAVAGHSVATAILSYVGKPVRLWRGQRWSAAIGWQQLGRARFESAGEPPLRRWIALADVPDHDLLPVRLAGHPAVRFRAGTERSVQMLALWVASWPVRWGWIQSLQPFARWLLPLQKLTAWGGGDRSAMSVTVRLPTAERCWTLIADKGDGPEIPTLAAALLADRILDGSIAPGARDAGTLLSLASFDPAFQSLAIRHATVERPFIPLYRHILGDGFDALAPALRRLHSVHGDAAAVGEGTVERGSSVLAQAIAAIMRFPPAGAYPVRVDFRESGGCERWIRDFGGHRFASTLSASGDHLIECFGPLRFRFALEVEGGVLAMRLCGWRAFGIPLPLRLAPAIRAGEREEAGRFTFDVSVAMPVVGPIIDYRGILNV